MSDSTAIATSSGNALLDAAHVARARGYRVIPLHRVNRVQGIAGPLQSCSCSAGLSCKSAGKHPVDKAWQNTPPMSGADVQATWDVDPSPNLGIATGEPSGLFVLDIDPDSGGLEAAGQLVAIHGNLPETRVVRTGSGGYHYYFAMPDFPVTNRNRWFTENGYLGIDIRGTGGQVVAPPSVSGKGAYAVVHDVAELAQAPEWLLEAVRPVAEAKPVVTAEDVAKGMVILPPVEVVRLARYAGSVVGREIDRLAACKVGMGPAYAGPPWNTTTFEVSCTLIQLAQSPWTEYTVQQAYADVFEHAPRDAGFTDADVNGCFESARTKVGDKARPMPERPAGPVYEGDPLTDPTAGPAGSPPAAGPQEWPMRSWDDLGNAQRMMDHYGDRLRWVEQAGAWAVYEGGRWQIDTKRRGHNMAQRMIESLPTTEALSYSAVVEDPDVDKLSPRDRFLKWVTAQRMSAKIGACLRETSGRLEMQAELTDFDRHEMLLNVANGVVDLITGALLPHDPNLMLMQQSPINYVPGATAPRWLRFLEEVQPSPVMRAYLQRISGYSATAKVGEQAMFLHHGSSGANGKSVYLVVASSVLGDYAQVVPRTTLLVSKGEEHPTAIARMLGKRFLQVSETAAGRRLDEEVVKNLTGGEKVTARYMGENFFDYSPTGKIHYVTNHLPRLTDAESIWRRLHMLVWPITIPEERRDPELSNTIIAHEAEGVLAWLVAGAVSWWNDGGLRRPPETLVDLASYREDQDEFGEFMRECLEITADPAVRSSIDAIYGAYQAWCFRGGIRAPLHKPDLSRVLRERRLQPYRTSSVRGFVGVRVRAYNGQLAETDPLA